MIVDLDIGIKENNPIISIEMQEIIKGGHSEAETYNGEYLIKPKMEKQSLDTKNKLMEDNVIIEQIPIHEFSNETGTTVVIGGIL